MLDEQDAARAWENVEERYQVGQRVQGVVSRIAQFGVFVQLEPGIEGIIYAFELGQGAGALARFAPGQEVQLYVKDLDARKRRLELSLEDQPLPGLVAEHDLPPEARRPQPFDALSQEMQLPPLDRLSLPLPPLPPELAATHSELTCPTCRRVVQMGWKHCVYCGSTLQKYCPVCGTQQPDLPDARYCCECGRPLR